VIDSLRHGYNSAVLPPRKWRSYLFVLAVVCVVPSLSGIVVEVREWHGRQIQCIHGGAWATRPKPCGTLDHEYEQVFSGTVRSVTEVSDTDRRLEITPDEIFLGEAKGNVTARVNQACLTPNDPEIKAGDKWLFYLRTKRSFSVDGKPTDRADQLEMPFDGPSKPLPQGQEDVAKLRRLARMTESGILSGNLLSFVIGNNLIGSSDDVQNHKIVATRQSDGAQYSALTNKDGNFEFDSLPVGVYQVTANTVDGLWAGNARKVEVHSGKCSLTQFWLQTDGIISGRIGSPDGKPFVVHPWVDIASVDDEWWTSAYVDKDGYYEARGVEPGRYVIGIGIRSSHVAPVPIPIYYPGVRSGKNATIIQLGRGQKRTHMDFGLPVEDVLRPF
jgi:Carboxypeptidase regulatory-like domain